MGTGAMTRTRPRNPYRSKPLLAAVHRAWMQRANLPDLDHAYRSIMTETAMTNDIELELTIRGRDRTLCLPRCAITNVSPALDRLDWFRRTAAIDQRVAERAEAALHSLARAAST